MVPKWKALHHVTITKGVTDQDKGSKQGVCLYENIKLES